ncbi:helicase-associated domain-containing protein [Micromonospora sp. DR5-3]|uniref:helicase-associated domain-containing protein n=1 Tax=unclassified Micromonospora TaxID=2617518 RepID=UPI0021048D88|nr:MULTISPECIES: helicase-associated domain-containing protein [unclassified Micromonospora]MCW3815725.1 helicase-associated domain-containing protein [Micromonospora sp. DR5-3]
MNPYDQLAGLDLPTLQVLEAALALGGLVAEAEVSALVGADAMPYLQRAADAGLVARLRGRLAVNGILREVFVRPLGVGPSAGQLATVLNVEDLKVVASNLGLPTKGRKADLLEAMAEFFLDTDSVHDLLKRMPAATRAVLEEADRGGGLIRHYGGSGIAHRIRYPNHYRQVHPLDWAEEHGLVYRVTWEDYQLAGQVAIALRGADYRAPFQPQEPPVAWHTPDPATVRRDAQAQGIAVVGLLSALLDGAGREPLTTVKAGGVGVRELTRTARTLGVTVSTVRLLLAVAVKAGLAALDERVIPTGAYDRWLRLGLDRRLAVILKAWRELDYLPSTQTGPWVPDHDEAWSAHARIAVLRALGDRAAPDLDQAAQWMWWGQPLAFGDATAARGLLEEATTLGVLGAGAISPAGQALLAGKDIVKAVGDLGDLARTARLQADLTVVVTGTPGPELAELLDAAAVVESRGTATTWRFSPASVRGAYDAGWTEHSLTKALTKIADGGLPQPLVYLLADVARQHGSVRVAPVASTLVSDDTALLAQICADKRLGKLNLRLLAPTVLASQATTADTMAALRKAGYAPRQQDADGRDVIERTRRHRA